MSTAEEQKRAEKSLLGVSDYNIERGILFLLVYNNNLQEKFPELNLREDMFLSPIGKAVYNILLEANNNNEFIDFKILEDKLAKKYTGEDLNNFFLLDKTWRPQEVLFDEYIQVFKRLYKRKEFLDELSNAEVAIKERDDDRLNGIKDKLQNFEFDTKEDDNEIGTIEASFLVESFNKMLDGDAEAKKRGEPLKTGLKDFDALIGGVERGNMIVLGARPSIGKSMTMLNIMESMHSLGYKVMYFSQEMQTRYVFNRIVARNLKINAKKFKDPSSFTPEERTQIKEYLEEYANDHSRHLYYNPDMSSADILAAAKKVKKKYGLDAIFIDYLGKIKPNSRLYKNRSMNDIVTEISGQIFALGSALNVAVFTASQLSRSGQKNQAEGSLYIPRMEDLRDSGSIEQDADMIFGLSMDRDAQKNWYG